MVPSPMITSIRQLQTNVMVRHLDEESSHDLFSILWLGKQASGCVFDDEGEGRSWFAGREHEGLTYSLRAAYVTNRMYAERSRVFAFPFLLKNNGTTHFPSGVLPHLGISLNMEVSQFPAVIGPPRKRREPSACRCLGITCLVFAAALAIWLVSLPIFFLRSQYNTAANPHKEVLHNGTAETAPSNSIIRPLIDGEIRFDVVLSIYARVANPDISGPDRWAELNETDEGSGHELALGVATGLPLVELRNDPPEEEVLFSENVLQGVSLRDEGLKAVVNLNLPLKRL